MSTEQGTPVAAFEPLTPERRRAMTRQHLLEAAAMVFARDGFQRSSLDEIAATAGFTKGAVYSNFKGKDDLFLAVLEERFERGQSAIRGALDTEMHTEAEWMPRIASAIRESMWDDNWTMLFLEFVLYTARNPDSRAKFATHVRRTLKWSEELISQEYEAAGTPPPFAPADLAIISMCMFDGLGVYRLVDPSFTSDRTLRAVLHFLSETIGFDEGATSS